MVARMLSLGLALGFSTLASLGLSPLSAAQAAYPSGPLYAGQAKRPQFRPWYRGEPQSMAGRWRPQMTAPAARVAAPAERRRPLQPSWDRRARQPVFTAGRTLPRKAVPMTRGQDLGVRFRPDERQSPYTQPNLPHGTGAQDAYQSELQSQFRPTRARSRPTYEQLQASNVASRPVMAPMMPYPMMSAPPLPGYGGHWPSW